MKYGFVIDNRKCIGCHACTTACKSEHQVPIGVNRTWVKQVEKGTFPNTRRLFSVMRCNHCTDAPCVEICPVEALFFRDDGIVDFDKDRCIGCKSCMQACPYDALYIDPDTSTAAKCNYCAHRIDIGLEPACVNVCPEHAIISGDMEDDTSEIAQLLSRQAVQVRKPEKATLPNLFYIDGDEASLDPTATAREDDYLWSSQAGGVGHFAKAAEKLAFSNGDAIQALLEANQQATTAGQVAAQGPDRSVDILLGKARRAYDVADKGILWGWEVSAYVFTKAIASGAFLIPFLADVLGYMEMVGPILWWSIGISLLFLAVTGLLLIKDLDRPDRFLNVLFRPQWNSWLVRGGYAISLYGLLLTVLALSAWLEWSTFILIVSWSAAAVAAVVAVYTAFLFAQAKGRDFWQSPSLSLHMINHSLMAGAAFFGLLSLTTILPEMTAQHFLSMILILTISINLLILLFELATPHPTGDSKRTVEMILKGRYKIQFWGGVVLLGNCIPLAILAMMNTSALAIGLASIFVLAGIYITEHIWVEAPQRIPLS